MFTIFAVPVKIKIIIIIIMGSMGMGEVVPL